MKTLSTFVEFERVTKNFIVYKDVQVGDGQVILNSLYIPKEKAGATPPTVLELTLTPKEK